MPKSKKIANPEYVELSRFLKAAQATSKKRQTAMTTAYAKVKGLEREVAQLEKQIESKREKLSASVEQTEDCVSASQDATAEVSGIIDRMKETPKMVDSDD